MLAINAAFDIIQQYCNSVFCLVTVLIMGLPLSLSAFLFLDLTPNSHFVSWRVHEQLAVAFSKAFSAVG